MQIICENKQYSILSLIPICCSIPILYLSVSVASGSVAMQCGVQRVKWVSQLRTQASDSYSSSNDQSCVTTPGAWWCYPGQPGHTQTGALVTICDTRQSRDNLCNIQCHHCETTCHLVLSRVPVWSMIVSSQHSFKVCKVFSDYVIILNN